MEQDPFEQQFKEGVQGVKRRARKTAQGIFSFKTVKFLLVLLVVAGFGTAFFFYNAKGNTTIGLVLKNRTGGSVDLEQGLFAHYTFDEASNVVADVSGNGNNGTLSNFAATTTTIGRIGQALSFDGVNDGVNIPNGATIASDSTFTWAMWLNIENTSSLQVVMHLGTSGGNGFGDNGIVGEFNIGRTSGKGEFLSDVDGVGASGNITTGWQHWTGVRDGSSVRFYVNGAFVATATAEATSTVSTFLLGKPHQATRFFKGAMDDVRIYDRVLSAEEIKRLYEVGATTKIGTTFSNDTLDNGLIGHWTLNGADISGTTATDKSGQGNSATIVNGSTKIIGLIGQALQLNGASSQYLDTPLSLSSPLTISMWAKPSTSQPNSSGFPTLAGGANTGQLEFGFRSAGGTMFYKASSFFSTSYTPDNQWHLFTITVDGSSRLSLYIDGVFKETVSASITTADLLFGRVTGETLAYTGGLDDIRVYNRALTKEEVRRLYDMGATTHINSAPAGGSLTEGLVGHWTFDGNKMYTNVADSSGRGNHGRLSGFTSTTTVIGRLGQALEFDRVDDHIRIGSVTSGTSITYAFWVKFPLVGRCCTDTLIWDGDTDGANDLYIHQTNADTKIAIVDGNGTLTSNTSLGLNQWKHVAIVTSDTDPKRTIYINGTADATSTTGIQSKTNTSYITLGGAFDGGNLIGGDRYWRGLLDDVRIYNRALSAEEVKRLYDMGR